MPEWFNGDADRRVAGASAKAKLKVARPGSESQPQQSASSRMDGMRRLMRTREGSRTANGHERSFTSSGRNSCRSSRRSAPAHPDNHNQESDMAGPKITRLNDPANPYGRKATPTSAPSKAQQAINKARSQAGPERGTSKPAPKPPVQPSGGIRQRMLDRAIDKSYEVKPSRKR